jgi:phenylacetate-CoA ligase
MIEYLDALETRTPHSREQALMQRLPSLIAQAKTAAGWATILKDVSANDINSRQALAQLPVTRKSDLKTLQQQQLPFGGLTTTAPRGLARIFMSPDRFLTLKEHRRTGGALRDLCMRRACAAVI